MSSGADILVMARLGDLKGLTNALQQGNVYVNEEDRVRVYIIHATFLCV